MDHSNHVRLTRAELTPDLLEGAGPDDEEIGSVDHVHGTQVIGSSRSKRRGRCCNHGRLRPSREDRIRSRAYNIWEECDRTGGPQDPRRT